MGDKFNLDSELNDDYNLTYSELIDEIGLDCRDDRISAYHMLTNSRKTGIIDRIENSINLDVSIDGELSREEKFERLKFIKYIYETEHDFEIPLLKILSKPRISHSEHEISEITQIADDISMQYEQIEEIIPKEERDRNQYIIDVINKDFFNLKSFIYNEILWSKDIVRESEKHVKILKKLKELLSQINIGEKNGEQVKPPINRHKSSVFMEFFNILNSYHYKCFYEDLYNNTTKIINENYSQNFMICMFFRKKGDFYISYDNIDKIGRNIVNKFLKNPENFLNVILEIINSGHSEKMSIRLFSAVIMSAVSDINIETRNVKFAFRYLENYLKILYPDNIIRDVEIYNNEGMLLSFFLAAIQELIYLSASNMKYTNDYLGFKNSTTLTSIIKSPEKADKIEIEILRYRFDFRRFSLIGTSEAVNSFVEIDKIVNEIMLYILSFTDIEDMLTASTFIHHLIDYHILPQIFPTTYTSVDFKNEVNRNCNEYTVNDVVFKANCKNLLCGNCSNLCRILAEQFEKHHDENMEFKGDIHIKTAISGCNEEYSHDITIVVEYMIDYKTDIIHINSATECVDEEFYKYLKDLGLEKILNND